MEKAPTEKRKRAWSWQVGLVLGAPSLLYPFGKDQGEYAYIGAAFLKGQVVEELMADPLQVILVANGDAQPRLTGTEIDSTGALQEFPELNEIVIQQYRLDKTIAQFSIYQHR